MMRQQSSLPCSNGRLAYALRLWLGGLACFAFLSSAVAQVQVNISLSRNLYMIYEPVICTVSITNLAGQELQLADTPRDKWFGFQVETMSGRPLPSVQESYRNEPLTIGPGQTIRRSVNLTPLYPITEFGSYRIRASIFVPALNRYFSSSPMSLEVTEGRALWEQTVGVPPDAGLPGKTRTYTLLTHRLPSSTRLYLRVRDEERGIVYSTTQLGRFLSYGNPEVRLDRGNEIHIIHNMAPKEFLYSHFGLDGKVRKQQAYQDWGTRPVLVPTTDGGISVVGGTAYDPKATPPERQLPGLGDRPVPVPAAGATPTPKKENSRPENLLSR
ncbi:MAG: hypothetical protein WEB60_12770 [Terrimicrobiaceae bacterium]